jgi:hypothetical protein
VIERKNIPCEPEETLSGSVLLLLELIDTQFLERSREFGGSKLASTDFLSSH